MHPKSFFYPRSPCGERLRRWSRARRCSAIFYPRSPCGERLCAVLVFNSRSVFSIHALLAESDELALATENAVHIFYPRSPCGERHLRGTTATSAGIFLSTLSLRRATLRVAIPEHAIVFSIHALLAESDRGKLRVVWGRNIFSIHALLAESDQLLAGAIVSAIIFYPRSPCGERPQILGLATGDYYFSIHALLAESDRWSRTFLHPKSFFYPRSPCGERLCFAGAASAPYNFLSTLSLRRATYR